MKAFYDFLRIAIACFGFVLLDPAVSSWFSALPEWLRGIIGVAISAGLTWGLFQLVNPTTQIHFSWREIAEGPEEEGPTLTIEARPGQPGQTYSILVQRNTPTYVGRAILRGFVRSRLRVEIEASQAELQMVLQSENNFVQRHGQTISVQPSRPKHPVNDVPFDLDLSWDEITRSEFDAKLRFEVTTDHFISTWLARLLVWVHPSVRKIRKVTRG
ncbi:hypothetical protein ACIPV2_13130 [Microbacterium sp. NPDC089987]|uniref:hypothetical protein n=1 Tax=Microbacterium sp. NPDC089987 TaxID=3364202 RepID=UPI0038103B57